MRWFLPSLLVYGLCFFLGYMVRISFQESHYPVVAPPAAVDANPAPAAGESVLKARTPAPEP